MKFQSKLSNKSNKQLREIENVRSFYKSQEEVTKFYNDRFKVVHNAAYDAKTWNMTQNIKP